MAQITDDMVAKLFGVPVQLVQRVGSHTWRLTRPDDHGSGSFHFEIGPNGTAGRVAEPEPDPLDDLLAAAGIGQGDAVSSNVDDIMQHIPKDPRAPLMPLVPQTVEEFEDAQRATRECLAQISTLDNVEQSEAAMAYLADPDNQWYLKMMLHEPKLGD